MKHRPERVGKLLREELSMIIAREFYFEHALATVTEIEVDKKLRTANAKISVLPEQQGKNVLVVLNRSRNQIQRTLFKKINIRPMPQIRFEYNPGLEKAANVEKILLEDE